ncbi:MAG: thioesterase family protein [Pseudomonadota bacterium]
MTSIDVAALTLSHHVAIPLRFGDTDMQGHVNNAVFATLYESGRVAFLYDGEAGMPPPGRNFVIAELNIRFLAEILYPATVDIRSGVSRIGNASAGLVQQLWVNDELKSTATSTVVMIDRAKRTSTHIDGHARAHLSQFLAVA